MAASGAISPATWALAMGTLVILGYVLYQVLGFRALRSRYRRLRELKANQRQVYRAVEALQRRSEDLLARVPHAARPAPYAADDERAMVLRAELCERLERLRRQLRSPEPGPYPLLTLPALLVGSYWAKAVTLGRELELVEGQRRDLARAEALPEETGLVLESIARKPSEVQRSWADLQAMAECLAQDVEHEQQRGTAGLVPLTFEAQVLRAEAMRKVESLREAPAPGVVQATVEAEALRPDFMARLADLQARAESVAGVHDRALGEQERLGRALAALESQLSALRPAMAGALRSQAEALQRSRQDLEARYGRHDLAAYHEVAQRALTLMAQAYSLTHQAQRMGESDREAAQAVEETRQAALELRQQVEEEQRRTPVRLDLCEAALARVERYVTQLQSLWVGGPDGRPPADLAAATTMQGQVRGLVASCRQELERARETVTTWQARRERIEGILGRLEAREAEHERLLQAWRELQGYARSNWPQVAPGWEAGYLQAREGLLAERSRIEATLAGGQAAESSSEELLSRCTALEQRWRGLLHDGRQVTVALTRTQAVERQVSEGLAALRPEAQTVARIEQELPADVAAAADLRQLSNDILGLYRKLEDEAARPKVADYRRLRDEGMTRLQEQLAQHKAGYAQLLDSERAALKRQLARVWGQWELLNQKLAKAVPSSGVDGHALARRWEMLLRGSRGPLAGVREILELRAQAQSLLHDVTVAQKQFDSEREAVREAEQRLAFERRAAGQLRGHLPKLLNQPHPRVVGEEWERCAKAWASAESLLRGLEPRRGVEIYLSRLAEATSQYQEAHLRGRSALVRLLRYAFLEDPDGMNEVCRPTGRRWGELGLTVRDDHIRDLLTDAEQAGQMDSLVERVESYLAGKGSAAQGVGGS